MSLLSRLREHAGGSPDSWSLVVILILEKTALQRRSVFSLARTSFSVRLRLTVPRGSVFIYYLLAQFICSSSFAPRQAPEELGF